MLTETFLTHSYMFS